MTLEEKIMTEIKAAMLAKDARKLEALRAVKAAILLEKTKGGSAGDALSVEDEIRLLQKLVKQRKESAEIFRAQNRVDLAEPEEFQYTVIEAFLPKQLGIEEVKKIIFAIIEKSGAQGIKDMGRVMSEASKQLAGKADNKTIAAIVKELLTGG